MLLRTERIWSGTLQEYFEAGRATASDYNFFPDTIEETRQEVNAHGEHAMLLKDELNNLVGILSIHRENEHLYISQVATLPAYQRKWIGTTAMKMLLDAYRGVPLVDLAVHPDNAPAIALYESVGFTKSTRPRIENYEGTGLPRIWMEWTRRDLR